MDNKQTAIAEWIVSHPYLDEVAKLQGSVLTVLEKHSGSKRDLADMVKDQGRIKERYQNKQTALGDNPFTDAFLRYNGEMLRDLVAFFQEADLPQAFKQQNMILAEHLKAKPSAAVELFRAALDEQYSPPITEGAQLDFGLVNYFLWNVLAETLTPLRLYLQALTKEIAWNEPRCPLCGEPPAMAQLVHTTKGRERELSCGLCHTKWQYKRIGCPYCGNEDQKSLNLIELTDYPAFRLDTCDQCKGYLKTYLDEGNGEMALNDWSTLHLDVIGKKEGFQRQDYQLFKI